MLALGAENNWADVKNSHGRSVNAGLYRDNWLYLSRTDHGQYKETPKPKSKSNWFTSLISGTPQTFFYSLPKTEPSTHTNYVARNAAAAVLSLTGACDQHAFVLASLLRAILPRGTVINICGLQKNGKNIPHTFVVVGDLNEQKSTPLAKLAAQPLLAVDAWPIQGGAVALRDYFLCRELALNAELIVDHSFIADGVDHLVKRVKKQKLLFDMITAELPEVQVTPSASLSSFIHHELDEQLNYPKNITRDRYLTESSLDYEHIFEVASIAEKYNQPIRSKEIFEYICEHYPHKQFKRCLEYVDEQFKAIINQDRAPHEEPTPRLNSAF